MNIEQLMNVINSLSAIGHESGYVSFRSDKGIIISPDKEFFKISDTDIEIVGKERNVNKEKAIHLTAYEMIADINVIIHVYPDFACRLQEANRSIYPYSATDARAIGAKLGNVIDNLHQITDSLKISRAALTPFGLFVAGATAEEAIERVEMIERAAKIEYLINAKRSMSKTSQTGTVGDNDSNKTNNIDAGIIEKAGFESAETSANAHSIAVKADKNAYKPRHLGYFKAKSIERTYINQDTQETSTDTDFIGNYGYYSRLDNGVLCASDVHSGEEIILNAKTAKNKIFKLLLSLYNGDFQGAAVVYNGENAVIVAGYDDTEFIRIDKLKSDMTEAVESVIKEGYILISGYGVLALGEDIDSAIAHAKEIDEKCGEYIAQHVIAK